MTTPENAVSFRMLSLTVSFLVLEVAAPQHRPELFHLYIIQGMVVCIQFGKLRVFLSLRILASQCEFGFVPRQLVKWLCLDMTTFVSSAL